MGFTIGDVLTIISLIAGFMLSLWAMVVGFAMLFSKKAESARGLVEKHPWRSFVIGALVWLVLGLIGQVLTAAPVVLLKFFGMAAYTYLVIVTVIGGSGLSLLVAEKIHEIDRRRSRYSSVGRAAALLIIGSILPVFGWILGGIAAIACVGAGFQSLVHVGERRRVAQSAPAPQAAAVTASVGNDGEFML
jgi:hypothetical protein